MSNYNTHTPLTTRLSTHIPGLTAEVGLYNMLLQVYMQNNHKFPPSEFMEKMREDGVMPNQVSVSGRNSLERKSLMFSLCCILLSSLLSPLLPRRQGTLMLLLQAYCNQGNMGGAMQILEHIKSLDLTINENVYAALITGHARANDIASAEKLLYEMRDQITPGLLSFTALLCAYAERGDMGSINKVSPWEGEGGEREREGRGGGRGEGTVLKAFT